VPQETAHGLRRSKCLKSKFAGVLKKAKKKRRIIHAERRFNENAPGMVQMAGKNQNKNRKKNTYMPMKYPRKGQTKTTMEGNRTKNQCQATRRNNRKKQTQGFSPKFNRQASGKEIRSNNTAERDCGKGRGEPSIFRSGVGKGSFKAKWGTR